MDVSRNRQDKIKQDDISGTCQIKPFDHRAILEVELDMKQSRSSGEDVGAIRSVGERGEVLRSRKTEKKSQAKSRPKHRTEVMIRQTRANAMNKTAGSASARLELR